MDIVRAAWGAGLSVLPSEPGEKIPAKFIGKWRRFQDERPSGADWNNWKSRQDVQSIGIVCGTALCVEAIDFDLAGAAYADWCAVVDPDVLGKCYVETSPSGGLHVIYRAPSKPDGNKKLCDWFFEVSGNTIQSHTRGTATINTLLHYDGNTEPMVTFGESPKQYRVRKVGDKLIADACAIETRGEGGWLIVAPSPGYEILQGSLAALPILTVDERAGLLQAARNMSDDPIRPAVPAGTVRSAMVQNERPGDRYMREGSHVELLEKHGWSFVKLVGNNEHWCRPGKTNATSATWEVDLRVFYVLSTSTQLETESPYSLFALLAAFEYGGDHRATAKELGAMYRGAAVQIAAKPSGGMGDLLEPGTQSPPESAVDDIDPNYLLAMEAAGEHSYDISMEPEEIHAPLPPANTQTAVATDATSREPTVYELNDFGNATRLQDVHGLDVRFCHTWGIWLTWEENHWQEDSVKKAQRMCRESMASTCDEALLHLTATCPRLPEFPNKYEELMYTRHVKMIDAHRKWRVRTQNRHTYENACITATTIEELSVIDADLDTDEHLFVVKNGCIDLRTATLNEAHRADLITCACNIAYDIEALSEDNPGALRWLKFLNEFTQGDTELVAFLQRWAGYCMTSSTKEQKFLFFQGKGGSGKSTFISTILAIIGSYAETANFEMFLKSSAQASRFALAKFQQSRLVVCEEVPEGREFSSDVLKRLTGGTPIEAERKYSNPYSYLPRFKLNLIANDAPRVSDQDSGFWRRICMIHCANTVEKVDHDLMTDLATKPDCQRAVLKWMVDGAAAWYANGLQIPESVQQASQSYRDDQDPIGAFLDDCTRWSDGNFVLMTPRKVVIAAYKQYCQESSTARPLGPQAFTERLRARGVEACRMRWEGRSERAWDGFRMIHEDEDTEPNTPPLSAAQSPAENCAAPARPALPETTSDQTALNLEPETIQNDEKAAHFPTDGADGTPEVHTEVRPPNDSTDTDLGGNGTEAHLGPHTRAITNPSSLLSQRDKEKECASAPPIEPPPDKPPPEAPYIPEEYDDDINF